MRSLIKTVGVLAVLCLCLLICLVIVVSSAFGIWLNTYKVFTEKRAVAEVVVSEKRADENGDYAIVRISEYRSVNAFQYTLKGVDEPTAAKENVNEFKIYGDTIYAGGPIMKFKDELILINFKTVYKLGKVFGRYDLDNSREANKSQEALNSSSYDINGGYVEWKGIYDAYTRDDLYGKFLRMFVDSTQVSTAGVFVQNVELRYTLFITNTGFLWNLE
jgi:hypothetical protein